METTLLATKLRTPPHRQLGVRRVRLIEALERGVSSCRLSLLSAPAGYGKTTLLAHWAHSSRFPIVWFSIDQDDNDLDRFLRYLVAGWGSLQPDVSESSLGILAGATAPDHPAILSAFINLAHAGDAHLVFVLDDYHLIENADIHQALTFLLDHLPPHFHVVLAGRSEPPLPIARYRARHELLELHAEDLRFLPQETEEFFNHLADLDLSRADVATLQAQLEGWIAGLQLAALTLRRRSLRESVVISGRHRYIADYLSQDVLDQLPDDLQRFLLVTSILDRMCGPLCDAVTGSNDGQAQLELLERENLFLVPLDESREWFRYHRLFADFLREELGRRFPGEAADLHRRAAGWYWERDLPDQAFSHAVAGNDVRFVVDILDRYANAKLLAGELRVVQRWLDSIQPEWYDAYPVIGLTHAGYLAYSGAYEACVRRVDEVEQRLALGEPEETRWQMARLTAVRCMMACSQNDVYHAEAYAQQALAELSTEDLGFRPGVYVALGDTYRQNGRWSEAKGCYLKALEISDSPAVRGQLAHLYGALADLDLRQGHLREAAAYWRKALTSIQDRAPWDSYPLPLLGWIRIRLGEILYEWNERAEAWEHVSHGLKSAEPGGDVRALLAGYLLAARIKLTDNDLEAAAESLELARPLVEQAQFPEWTSRFERLQLEIWLAQDRLRAAVGWADDMQRGDTLEPRPEHEPARLAVARILIVKGDAVSVERALALLDRLRVPAQAEGRTAILIEVLALQALVHWRRGDHPGAMTSLERALRLAEAERYVRLFADLGLPMVRLLQEARARAVLPEYVDSLLAASGADPAQATSSPDVRIPEPLSPREQEILALVAAGLTNREVADQLVISPETVKKHTSAIFGKLAVGSRTQAVAKARELGLLD